LVNWYRYAWGPGGAVPAPQYAPMQSVPKIYLCSRTHSQLHQLVRELKRTPYRPKYTILGSRKQYCPIKKSDEECMELTKDKMLRPTVGAAQPESS
jgi:Rad3-related DNA helicase